MNRIPSQKFLEMRAQHRRHHWERERRNNGWNYAQAAKAHGITLREWGMLECGVSPEDLRAGLYPRASGGRPINRPSSIP